MSMTSPGSGHRPGSGHQQTWETSPASRKQPSVSFSGASTPTSTPSRKGLAGTRPPRRAHQAREQWDKFADERTKKKKREPRRTLWPDFGGGLRPEDPTLLEAILSELAERTPPSSPSSGRSRPTSAPEVRRPQASLGPASLGSLGPASPGATLPRPQSAPIVGSSPRRQQTPGKSRPRRPQLLRPQSAPRLLDGSGLLEKRPHRSPFLQQVEDSAVKETITKFKRDSTGEKAATAKMDMMHDTSLFDLKVLHNATARKRTEKIRRDSPPRVAENSKGRDARGAAAAVHRIGPRHPKWNELPAVDQMRNLCHVMDMDMRLHGRAPRETSAEIVDADIEPGIDRTAQAAEELSRSKPLLGGFSSSLGALDAVNFAGLQPKRHRTSNFLSNSNPETVRITVNLLDFILDKCSSLVEFAKILQNGKVTRREFETVLMALGYVSDDPSRFFRALDNENAGELLCDELVDALEAYGPNLIEKRLSDNSRAQERARAIRHRATWSPGMQRSQAVDLPERSPIASESEASEC